MVQKTQSLVQPCGHVNVHFPTLMLVCEVEHNLCDNSHVCKKTYFMFFYFFVFNCSSVPNVQQRMYTTVYLGLFMLWNISIGLNLPQWS